MNTNKRYLDGEKVKEVLRKRRMKQADLARQCFISESMVTRLISGERRILDYQLEAFAKALRCPAEWILEGGGVECDVV